MANDPNRDILPVKDCSNKNASEDLNLGNVSRLKRSELEDKYFRLYEDYSGLKHRSNSQEEKIKKIGTKLLRVIREKRKINEPPPNNFDFTGSTEDLQVKIIELQHENYILKDKTTVLKQQLASHAKQHMAAHPSSSVFRPSQPSPRLTNRQVSVPNINDGSFTLSNLPNSSDLQLRDAEAHIGALNEEIKTLHSKIDSLQNEVEKSSVVHQKIQVGENIELIKLKRLNKQLDAQLKAAEHSQKVLQKDNSRLQRENEDALQLINDKQNEIIDIQGKVIESSLIQVQFQELKESIVDLTSERNLLKERCEVLLKTVKDKHSESQVNSEVVEIKKEAALLRQELEMMKMENLQASYGYREAKTAFSKNNASCQTCDNVDSAKSKAKEWKPIDSVESQILEESSYNILNRLDALKLKPSTDSNQDISKNIVSDHSVSKPASPPPIQPEAEPALYGISSISLINVLSEINGRTDMMSVAENLTLQREAEYLRDMLRAQTHRCDTLEVQIMRLTQEIHLNEKRYKDIVQQRDLFYRLLDNGSRNKCLENNEDRQSMNSEREGSGCPSGVTYTKNVGTYTKTSPVDILSQVSSPAVTVFAESGSATVILSPKESAKSSVKGSPVKAPLPVPRTRKTDSKPKILENISNTLIEVKVSILWLKLDGTSKLWADKNVKAMYVDFTILSKSSENYETPQALPKPTTPEMKSMYNFDAVLPWNESMMNLLKEKKLEDDVIVFNVVSEPVDDTLHGEIQCPVVGLSTVNLHQFIFADPNEDILLPIFEIGLEKVCCGTLAVRLNVPPVVSLQFK